MFYGLMSRWMMPNECMYFEIYNKCLAMKEVSYSDGLFFAFFKLYKWPSLPNYISV